MYGSKFPQICIIFHYTVTLTISVYSIITRLILMVYCMTVGWSSLLKGNMVVLTISPTLLGEHTLYTHYISSCLLTLEHSLCLCSLNQWPVTRSKALSSRAGRLFAITASHSYKLCGCTYKTISASLRKRDHF